MSSHARRSYRTAIWLCALGAAVVLAALAGLFLSGVFTSNSSDKELLEIQKRLMSAVRNAPSKETASDRADQLLASLDDPRVVRHLAYVCSDTGNELCNNGVEDDYEQGEKFWWAWYSCVSRLVELGRSGDRRAPAELWQMHESGRYDAGSSESIITAISRIGKPALPFLRSNRILGSGLARQLIEAIEKGEILE